METEKPEGTEPTPTSIESPADQTAGAVGGGNEETPKGVVTVTAKEDCNLLVGGQSVALAAGDSVQMTPQEAAAYANLGLVELSAGTERAVPKRK